MCASDAPSVLDLRDSPSTRRCSACSFGAPDDESGGSSEFTLRYRSLCLRDSGAVAPSALSNHPKRPTDSPDIALALHQLCMYFKPEFAERSPEIHRSVAFPQML